MTPREILKKIRQIELRTNRIVTEFAARERAFHLCGAPKRRYGATAAARFTARTTGASKTNRALNSIRALKWRERRAPSELANAFGISFARSASRETRRTLWTPQSIGPTFTP